MIGINKLAAISSRTLIALAAAALFLSACESRPRNVPVNSVVLQPRTYPLDTPKPLPGNDPAMSEPQIPGYYDPPIVDQRLPEEAWFLNAYNQVGRPRIAVFINRTLEGQLIPAQPVVIGSTQTVQSSSGAVDVNHSSNYTPYGYGPGQSDSFKSTGPAQYTASSTNFAPPSAYDEAQLSGLDYQEMESLLTGFLSCGGQVTLISPDFVRSKLSSQQLGDLQAGKADGLEAVGTTTNADLLIQFTAHSVRRPSGLYVLLVGEAVNIRGGESISQASVEMPTPVERAELNNFTRFLSRKLLHGMVQTWQSAPPTNANPSPTTRP